MFMKSVILFLALLTLAFANLYNEREISGLNGSCGDTANLITEEDFVWGYEAFCDKYLGPSTAKLADGYHRLSSRENDLVATYDLKNIDKKVLRWVSTLCY